MPKVYSEGGFVVKIYFNDHLPCHVHVFKGGTECIINLVGENGLPRLREINGMKKKDVASALRIVYEQQDFLREKWKNIHNGIF